MPAEIRSVDTIENPFELKELVRDYLTHELRELHAVSGIRLDLDELVATTFEHIDEYLPPQGRLHLATSSEGQLIGCVFLKMIRADAAEVKRLYVRRAVRDLAAD